MKFQIENWRWAGVPFYVRAGKRLAKRFTDITIQFKQPPTMLFKDNVGTSKCGEIQPNWSRCESSRMKGFRCGLRRKCPGHR